MTKRELIERYVPRPEYAAKGYSTIEVFKTASGRYSYSVGNFHKGWALTLDEVRASIRADFKHMPDVFVMP